MQNQRPYACVVPFGPKVSALRMDRLNDPVGCKTPTRWIPVQKMALDGTAASGSC
jgi:hypothetical protein